MPPKPDTDTFPHDADVGVIGRGPTVEAAFEAAARATFGVMTDLAQVRPARTVTFEFVEPDVELALVTWLNALLARAGVEGIVFGRFTLTRSGDRWTGSAAGEPWREALERGTQVKGATLTGLSVTKTADGYEARCVIDV